MFTFMTVALTLNALQQNRYKEVLFTNSDRSAIVYVTPGETAASVRSPRRQRSFEHTHWHPDSEGSGPVH